MEKKKEKELLVFKALEKVGKPVRSSDNAEIIDLDSRDVFKTLKTIEKKFPVYLLYTIR